MFERLNEPHKEVLTTYQKEIGEKIKERKKSEAQLVIKELEGYLKALLNEKVITPIEFSEATKQILEPSENSASKRKAISISVSVYRAESFETYCKNIGETPHSILCEYIEKCAREYNELENEKSRKV